MTEPVHIPTDLMREIAADHDGIAAEVDEFRGAADEVVPATQTWPAITHATKAATAALMSAYGDALAAEAASHSGMSDELRVQASAFETVDEANATNIGGIV